VRAVILLAGMGSRLGELTTSTPKSLLPIGASTTLERMIGTLAAHGVQTVVLVCGHMQEAIEAFLIGRFGGVEITVLRNADYATTNTGYSLLIAREKLDGKTFLKLDGDVVFDERILERLVAAPGGVSYACVDRTEVDDEVIKVQCDADGAILRIGNRVPVIDAAGESIGIERIDEVSSGALFEALEALMEDPSNRKGYYEIAYDAIVQAGEPFGVVDVTGLPWVEVDTVEDYELALRLFG